MTDKIIVMSTCGSAMEAEAVARALLEKRLAACVNIMPPGRSIYHWKGAIEEAAECVIFIKSRRPLLGALRTELAKTHSYEIPEVIALPIVDGSPEYLDWLERETSEAAR